MKKIALVVVIIFIVVISLFKVSKARDFQFFGEVFSKIPNRDKKIALTFDDGPTESTKMILEKLDDLNVKATFFLCGESIEKRPQDVKDIVNNNHSVGNHSYSHKRMMLVSYDFCKEEIEKTNRLIQESGYKDTIFFRPPYGKKLFTLPKYLSDIGMKAATWDVEPETHLGFNASPKEIAQNVIDNVESGSIILLHPMYNDNVIPALDIIVKDLISKGYYFETLPKLYNDHN